MAILGRLPRYLVDSMSILLRMGLVLMLWVAAGRASAQMYAADLSSAEWKLAAGPFACSLTHKVPGFGQAILSRKAGGVDTLVVEAQNGVAFPVGLSGVETLPPVWRNDLLPQGLGSFKSVAGPQPIVLSAPLAAAVTAQLGKGIKVMFTSQPMVSSSSSSGIQVMRVVLEAKNFVPAYKTYQQCLDGLIPYNFAQVARTLINYAEKPTGLTPANKSDLNRVARYVKADPKVLGIFVDGHSDNAGAPEANEAVSKQESEWVSAFLVEQGVPGDKITTRWHADKFPIADNKLPAGRAQNRRVTVRLENEATRKEVEQKAAAQEAIKQAEAKQAEAKQAEVKAQPAEAVKPAAKNANVSDIIEPKHPPNGSKLTPEQINHLVEGLDRVNGK